MKLPDRNIQQEYWQQKRANYSVLKQRDLDVDKLIKEKEDLGKEINTDPLTKIYNRRLFENKIEELNNSRDVGVVFFDVDKFKDFNDKYDSHAEGDKVLKRIGQVMKDNCHTRLPSLYDQVRPFDYPFRIGGDEFALILTDIKSEDVAKVVNRITNSLKQESISLSSGFAVTSKDLSLKEALKKADHNMYQQKDAKKMVEAENKSKKNIIKKFLSKLLAP
jgi:diguanylate cyclase